MHWEHFRDDRGEMWACAPYVIRAYQALGRGRILYKLDGAGIDSSSHDVDILKMEAENHRQYVESLRHEGIPPLLA